MGGTDWEHSGGEQEERGRGGGIPKRVGEGERWGAFRFRSGPQPPPRRGRRPNVPCLARAAGGVPLQGRGRRPTQGLSFAVPPFVTERYRWSSRPRTSPFLPVLWCCSPLVRKCTPSPPCDIPLRCCFFTGPWTVTRSSLRMLRRVAAFCRPLRPVLLLVSLSQLSSGLTPGSAVQHHRVHGRGDTKGNAELAQASSGGLAGGTLPPAAH